jgi:hypothetical protein
MGLAMCPDYITQPASANHRTGLSRNRGRIRKWKATIPSFGCLPHLAELRGATTSVSNPFRDYFYYMMNIAQYPDMVPYAKVLAERFFKEAEGFITELGIADTSHPELFVPYSEAN